jgi:hypothetical protein
MVQLLALLVTQGRVLLLVIIFIILALLLLGLLNRGILSLWALTHHNLYLKRLLPPEIRARVSQAVTAVGSRLEVLAN